VLRTHAGGCAPQSDIPAIAEIIGTFLDRWKPGQQITEPDTSMIASYERRNAAQQLAEKLNQLTTP
jgi:hypothetical protein